MTRHRTFHTFLFTLYALFLPSAAVYSTDAPNHLTVQLHSEEDSIQPGKDFTVGFHFQMEKGWHIYWQNPGDSGQTPSVTWKLPPGFKVGPLQWPIPERIVIPSLVDYGYNGEVLLMATLHAPKRLKAGQAARISAEVHWLVCKESCIPGQARLELQIPVKNQKPAPSPKWSSLFQSTRKNLPLSTPKNWEVKGFSNPKDFQLDFETDIVLSAVSFFPLHPNQVENAAPQAFSSSGKAFQLKLKRSDQLLENVKTLEGLLVFKEENTEKGYWVDVPLSSSR